MLDRNGKELKIGDVVGICPDHECYRMRGEYNYRVVGFENQQGGGPTCRVGAIVDFQPWNLRVDNRTFNEYFFKDGAWCTQDQVYKSPFMTAVQDAINGQAKEK